MAVTYMKTGRVLECAFSLYGVVRSHRSRIVFIT